MKKSNEEEDWRDTLDRLQKKMRKLDKACETLLKTINDFCKEGKKERER